MLAACSGSQVPLASPGAFAPPAAGAAQSSRGGSWMVRDAAKHDLLYVSDYETNDVYAYSYPQGKRSGELKGILKESVLPAGLCADGTGNVFIPDSGDSKILEYAHGSTKLVNTLVDPGEIPYSCAFDTADDTLAVINLESVTGPGGVSIYSHARGRPKEYEYGFIYKYYFAAYDGNGDLFVDATDDVPSEPFAFLELPKGATLLQEITLDHDFRAPGGVAWDGKYVLVAGAGSRELYRFAISGSGGTDAGQTSLRDGDGMAQFLIDDERIVGANFRHARVTAWRYPSGGAPAQTISGFGEPFGVTLSKAPP
jgi:hypothetical protein